MDLLAPFRKPRAPSLPRVIPLALPALLSSRAAANAYVVPRVRNVETGEIDTLDHVMARHPRAVLIGEAGAGTSSGLLFLAAGTPILSLADFHPLAPPQRFADPARILLDDVAPSQVHGEYLARLAAENRESRIYLAAEDASTVPSDFVRLALLPFHERELLSAVQAWMPDAAAANALISAAKGNPVTRQFLYNPLDLFLLIQIYRPGAPLPANRAALFEAYLDAYLKHESDPDFARRALEGIALSTKRGQLAKDEHLARGYGLLHEEPSGRVVFAHKALHDFLAASALRRNPDLAPLLEHLHEEQWHSVVLFYVGRAAPASVSAIVETLCERGQWDFAAQALGQAAEMPEELQRRVAELLIRRVWDEQDTRALESLSVLRSPAANDFFAARLKERDPQFRARAARALGRLQNDRAVEALLPQLRDTNLDVRDQVVAALGDSKSDRVIEPLLVALRGDHRVGAVDTRLRVAAARALGRTGSEKAVPALIVDLTVGEPEVRAAAANALALIRSQLAYKPLQSTVESNATDEVRAAAQETLNAMRMSV